MPIYRLYYCDLGGKMYAADLIEATSDRDAVAIAHAMAYGHAPAFDLWEGNRLVERHNRWVRDRS